VVKQYILGQQDHPKCRYLQINMVSRRSVLDRHQDPFENHKSRVRFAIVQAFGQRPPPRRSRFEPIPIEVRTVVGTVAPEQIFLPVLRIPLSVPSYRQATFIHRRRCQRTKLRRLKPRLRQTVSMLGRSTFGNYQNLQKSIHVALSTYVILFFTTLVRNTFGCNKHLEI
jgi:hypothetical protein